MKNVLLGIVMALVFMAGLFAAAHYLKRPTPEAEAKAVAEGVKPGFVGNKQIGVWVLACADKTRTISAKDSKPAVTIGRCRTSLQLRRRDNPNRVALGLNFRLIGPRLTMVLRIPPVAKKGDDLIVELGHKGLKLPVAGCGKTECIAIAGLPNGTEAQLFSGHRGAVIFPVGPNGKRRIIPFPLTGLPDAVSALKRASSATPA